MPRLKDDPYGEGPYGSVAPPLSGPGADQTVEDDHCATSYVKQRFSLVDLESCGVDSILAKYLKDGSLESQGQFTISPQKALEKFGRHAFPRNSAWITKVLQAVATGSPSPKMSVSWGPKSIRVNLAGGWHGGADAVSLMSEVLNLKEKGLRRIMEDNRERWTRTVAY